MTAPIPAERIHLRMAGQPQEHAEMAALVLVATLKFCAQSGTFPLFMAFAQADLKRHPDYAAALKELSPGILHGLESYLAAGMVADLEGDAR